MEQAKPVRNPELNKAIQNAKKDPGMEYSVWLLNEVVRAKLLIPVSLDKGPEYDKALVRPGKEGKIEIAFNSEGRYGKQYKEIRIFANIPEKQVILSFTATVKE